MKSAALPCRADLLDDGFGRQEPKDDVEAALDGHEDREDVLVVSQELRSGGVTNETGREGDQVEPDGLRLQRGLGHLLWPFEVKDSGGEKFRAVLERADGSVAVMAQEAPNLTTLVVVVDAQA